MPLAAAEKKDVIAPFNTKLNQNALKTYKNC